MSKITFRADAELVERVESLDASKSEVMRRALRAYLDEEGIAANTESGGLDALLDARIDERVARRLEKHADQGDVTVNVNVADDASDAHPATSTRTVDAAEAGSGTGGSDTQACPQCGEELAADHAFCPNCGERAGGHPTCDCGAELRSDWAFCPDCGRRTVAGDILDR